ncbi:hypothetical protein ATANTOWER_015386 [Ataeniobius toweri]|uniref:non-specific serine/threonine protein kinase n=1 Tax=Ataeniobius toweri TaxID=208326 RepID=A0ABU7C2Y9_9TELE|nr:hypothetical protein [Ataeniobius toweri]
MARSSFGNGCSSNGNDVSGRSRSSGCSYLSNVRPENRSTLCSVMAQLAEEMQPSFVTTLRSKAVSENCNVKFTCVVTGHPVPQVTWYKDDKQLDRYCGLPKYEIFHNGQNNSLHIYNCTVDDAAIYQASAINSKGIVSCSGVLEVGEMNEFKIHQRYFAKLKHKVENKCRETQEKENLKPLRTISPDRTQRKRRSTKETFVSTPSPIEDEGNEAKGIKTECRLQKGTVEEVSKNPASDTNESVSVETNGQINNDPSNKSGTYMYDPDHKVFFSHQPKSPFVMKKIKISDSTTHPKPEMFGERKMKDDSSSFAAPVCTKIVQINGNSEEVMEVENIVSLSLTNANSENMKRKSGTLSKEEAVCVKNLSKDGNMFNKSTVSLERENVTTSKSSVAVCPSPTVSENEGKKIAKHKNEGKDTEKCLERQNQVPDIVPAQNKSSNKGVLSIKKEDIDKKEHIRTLDIEVKSYTSLNGSGFSKPVDTSCGIRAVSPQCPCERTESLLSEKETSTCQKKESVSQPALPSEVTEANADMNWNDAPVSLKLPLDQHNIYSEPPQKRDDILTSPLSSGPQPSPDKITQDTSDDSRKSNGSCTAIFTHPQKSAHEILGRGESIPESNVSSVTQQSQVDTVTKTFEGTEIQEDEKLEVGDVGRLVVQALNGIPSENILEMKTETTGLHDQTNAEENKDVGNKDSGAKPAGYPIVETKKSQSTLREPAEEQTSVAERQSPLLTRRKMASETQTQSRLLTEKIHAKGKPTEKDKYNPFKAPQVIRKIRGETFADGSGHLKLWCQFFNVLSDSSIKWYKNEQEIDQVKKSAGDETQVNLVIIQASSKDSGVYGCSIINEYGSDSTDLLLSADILAGMSLREDLGVGEEIEMTPFMFSKGLADSGNWGNKFFGRIMMTESCIGYGCSRKAWRAKVIYGLEPVFESGNTCIIKVRSPIIYGGKEESSLIERNLHMMKQECRIQNLAREYCKIFTAEARVIENFGPPLEVIPVYLMYRPAHSVPYATVETDLIGVYKKYSVLDNAGKIDTKTGSEVEQKCCALQHWVFQWTTGNLLLTRLEGVDTKITNVRVSVKSTGHQGLSVEGNPKVFHQFVSQHKCNYFCGLLGLRSLKVMDSLSTPTKPKGSKSPLLQRKKAVGSSSPQTSRKATVSPRMPRKAEHEGNKTPSKQEDSDAHNVQT